MAPVVPCSVGHSSLISGTVFTTRKNNCLTRYSFVGKSSKQHLFSQKFILPLSISVKMFPLHRDRCILHQDTRFHILSALGTNVAVEEPVSEVSNETSEVPLVASEASEGSSTKTDASAAPAQSKRSRPNRKSEMPPVKNEELVPGAIFNGKVRSIQPFGAFIDFGAFTDGLVHISQLSDSFVKDVGSFVSVGQEVKVRVVEVNAQTGRISLTMREKNDNSSKTKDQKDAPASSNKVRPSRKSTSSTNQKKDEVKKNSKFVKGQDLQGTVKNLTRAGAFISLPEDEEGFLPKSEEADDAFVNVMGGTSLRVGQEISVSVLRVTRGNVTLTMKKKESVDKLNSQLNQGVVHVATNPFVLAFRKNKYISAFLDEREKLAELNEKQELPGSSEDLDGKANQIKTESAILDVHDSPASDGEELVDSFSHVDELVEDQTTLQQVVGGTDIVNDALISSPANNELLNSLDFNLLKTEDLVQTIQEQVDISAAPEGSTLTINQAIDKVSEISGVESNVGHDVPQEAADEILSSESTISKEEMGNQAHNGSANDNLPVQMDLQTSLGESDVTADMAIDAEQVGATSDNNASISSSNGQVDASANKDSVGKLEYDEKEDGHVSGDQLLFSELQVSEKATETGVVESRAEDEAQIQKPLAESNTVAAVPSESEKAEPVPEENNTFANSSGQIVAPPNESSDKVAISPALVKQLREETGAGMMDCKRALSETGGDIVKAQEFLRKKGLASADKKASRATAEGRIGSYIHDGRIGVLIEVNCETDFVSRGDIFKELVDDLAMQVAACPQVQHLVTEDVPEEFVNKEREIEMQKEDLLSKPEQIRSKIVEGRVRKRLEELALLEQPYIKNDKVVVKDWVKQTIATIGENIKVKRFVRYNLGEGLEKKSQDFAAEVAAQTAAQPAPTPAKEQPATNANEDTIQKSPSVTISAALVKQLREETGAGMMDCKKALSETGGDLEKAQEYLRKKGLSTADKKSSRLAAEGRIGTYIHDARIGVLIEVNCETDFVGRSEKFKELVDDLAMQVVACPQVQFVAIEDIPDSIVRKEKELEMQREDLLSKPENIRERIVEGRLSKRLGELTLLEQPFIKNDGVLVKDLVKQTVAALGENVKVRRFVRFTLGETTDNADAATKA